MNTLRIVFAGTPEFACPALSRLIEDGHRPAAVLTRPDRPAGRGRKLTSSPVKQLAAAHDIPVLQPRTLKTAQAHSMLDEAAPDLLITAAYGLLLPPAVLERPAHGCWNLHASLLPRWRGASPIQQAILAGDRQTGISLMQMDAGLDTGPVLLERAVDIDPAETAGQLHDRLSRLAAEVLADGLGQLESGRLPEARPQDETLATHAPRIDKADGRLVWHQPADRLARQVRAYNPWPVAFGEIGGQTIRVFAARADDDGAAGEAAPGTPLPGPGDRLRIACGRGVLEITELQSPGKRRMAAADWLNAHPHWQ